MWESLKVNLFLMRRKDLVRQLAFWDEVDNLLNFWWILGEDELVPDVFKSNRCI